MAISQQLQLIMPASDDSSPDRSGGTLRARFLFAVWLVYGSLAGGQDTPKIHLRFFNDSAKAVNFYVDDQLGCSVQANPEENLAYCDAEIGIGKHRLSVKGSKLPSQSCDLFAVEGTHAEGTLSKGERFRCSGVLGSGP
jgi:hypothetical protein